MKSLLITSITLLCAVTNLLAQDRPDARRRPREGRDEGGKPGEAFFERFDKDNNGSLSKEEFNALRETIAKWRGTPDRGPAEARREGDKGREPGMRKGEGDKPNRPHPEAMRRGPGLTFLFDRPFSAVYKVAEGDLILRFKNAADGVKISKDILHFLK